MEKTDNELIAEFMGMELFTPANKYYRPYYREFDTEGLIKSEHHPGTDGLFKSLCYDSSWDWLMPVVEKIQTLDDNFSIHIGIGLISNLGMMSHYNYCHVENYKGEEIVGNSGNATLIESVYKAVVEFIKWYNSSKQ